MTLPTASLADDARTENGEGFTRGSGTATGRSSIMSSVAPWFRQSRDLDGSARSIRLHSDKSLRQMWKDSQTATKVTYILMVVFVLTVYFGVRSLRFAHSQISLNCSIKECTLSITPVGWKRKASITIPRSQLHSSLAVKTTFNGTYVSSNPSLNENLNPNSRHNKKHPARTHKSPSVTYKGPDANGHYVSYAVVLADSEKFERSDADEVTHDSDGIPQPADLTPIQEYLQSASNVGEETERMWLLTFHLFGISHSKRRVRTMMTRIDSYLKRRRHTLNVKEAGHPSWVGILCVVFGLLGFFLTLLLGQCVDMKPPTAAKGPGARRQRHSQSTREPALSYSAKASRSTSMSSTYLRTTPARYEVRMQPASINSQKLY